MTTPRSRRPSLWTITLLFWAAFLPLHLAATLLTSQEGVFLWYFPAALSVALLLIMGPRLLPAILLAPLPVDLVLNPLGLRPWGILGLAAAYALGHALAVAAFRGAGLSPRLRRTQDVAGFLVLVLLGPLLASLPAHWTLLAAGSPGASTLSTLRTILLGDAIGVLTLAPALLVWVRPLVTLGRRPAGLRRGPVRPAEFLAQSLALCLVTWFITRHSEPGSLHLKYLLFLPMVWMSVRGGLPTASLGFPLLALALTFSLARQEIPVNVVSGIQSFLVVLFGMALFLGAAVDARREAQRVAERAARRVEHLVEGTGAIPWEMDLESGATELLGPVVEARFGWPRETWRQAPYWEAVLLPEDHARFRAFLQGPHPPEETRQEEFRLRGPGGDGHWIRVAGGLDPESGGRRAMGFLFDIHEHREAEDRAHRASLAEKDLLLREIHHRVKNNLQVVSSLLRLQAAGQTDPAIQRALLEAQERVQAIALIHQKLKHAPDFSHLDLPDYIRGLAERLVRSYASVPALIDLKVEVAPVALGPDLPVPLGLILHELLSNALQHGFPPGQGGDLDIELTEPEPGHLALRVADSGQGLPEGVDLDSGGLGFQMVSALTDQVGGTLELERRRGVAILITFPATGRRP